MNSERRVLGLARVGLGLAALFIFVVGAIFRVDQMFLMALALALLPGAAWLIGRGLSGGVACTRTLPALCAAGEAVPVTLTVDCTARLPRPAVRISDDLPRRLRPVGDRAALLLNVRPRERREVTYWLEAERRGHYVVGPVRVETWDPLGFHAFVQHTRRSAELAVYPAPLPLRRVFWEDVGGGGMHSREASARRGNGLEFHGVREYQPGDELRHVHWRTTARTGTLAVAEYVQGASRDTVVALDLSQVSYAGTGDGVDSALEYAVTLAASVCAFLFRRGYSVRLLTPADQGDASPPSASPSVLPCIFETLVGAQADSPVSLGAMLDGARALLSSRPTLVCITPDPRSPALAAVLSGLAARGVAVVGLGLEAATFRGEAGPQAEGPSLLWRCARRGDDLLQFLEG